MSPQITAHTLLISIFSKLKQEISRYCRVIGDHQNPKIKMTDELEGNIDLFSREAQSNAAYEKIKTREVCIAGCGNVGTVVATILAESGICDMKVIDLDDFSYIDNRQLYSTEGNMGVNKAIATARGVAARTDCYVKPYDGNAIEIFKEKRIELLNHDIFLCVDSVKARKEIYDAAIENVDGNRNNLGKIIDVGVEDSTIQVAIYNEKSPHDMYFDNGQAACIAIPLASFRAFMAASIMVGAYFSLFETKETEDKPMVPEDHALQIYTNTMEKFLRSI